MTDNVPLYVHIHMVSLCSAKYESIFHNSGFLGIQRNSFPDSNHSQKPNLSYTLSFPSLDLFR